MELLQSEQYYDRNLTIFDQLKRVIINAIPFARVEHIGASAIPGAVSKGDLDIFVGVPKNKHEECLEKIISLGFKIKEDTLRTDSLCMLISDEYACDTAIQLVVNGSEFEFFLTFRNKLMRNESLLLEYNRIKQQYQSSSEEEYRKAKSTFINDVLALS